MLKYEICVKNYCTYCCVNVNFNTYKFMLSVSNKIGLCVSVCHFFCVPVIGASYLLGLLVERLSALLNILVMFS